MAPIRNACVGRGQVPSAGGVVGYVVPTGNVFLLKSVLMRPTDPGAYLPIIYLTTADTTVTVQLERTPVDAGNPLVWSGWVAMNPGDYVTVTANGSACDYWISGAVLPFNPTLSTSIENLPSGPQPPKYFPIFPPPP